MGCATGAPARRRGGNRIAAAGALLACAAALPAPAAGATAPDARAHWAALPGPPAIARTAALTRPTWLSGVLITEYWPVPESWFKGRRVRAAGLANAHRIDWLFSARGVTMQGTGIGLDGSFFHVVGLGRGGWVDRLGRPAPIGGGREVFWRAGGFWRNPLGTLTFPLEDGGWASGIGLRYLPLPGVSFAPGHGRPGLRYYRSLAVDPALIPMGSRVYIPAYRGKGGGWFLAQDTGGAIRGRHVDVYRRPPESQGHAAQSLRNQRILVVPPGRRPLPVPPQSDPPPEPSKDKGKGNGKGKDDGGGATGGSPSG